MAYRPHEHLPLLLFGLVLTPLSITGLLDFSNIFTLGLAAMLAIFASATLVVGIVTHWRHG